MENQQVEIISDDAIQARMDRLRVELSRESEILESLGIETDMSEESLRTRAIESLQEDYALRDSLGAEMDRRREELFDSQPNFDSDPDESAEPEDEVWDTLWNSENGRAIGDRIVNLIECVFSLPGNIDETEILKVAKELQNFTVENIKTLHTLYIEVDNDDEV